MNKKVLFYYLLSVILFLPIIVSAQTAACAIIRDVKNALSLIGATLIIVGWVVAGIIYLTSIGKQEQMTTGKRAIMAAIIGTILVILATVAASIIGSFFPGATLPNMCT